MVSKASGHTCKTPATVEVVPGTEALPPSLRGLHAWLARDPNFAGAVIAADPVGVIAYGDADTLTPEQAAALLAALQRVSADNPMFWLGEDVRAHALVSPALRDEVGVVLRDKGSGLGLRALLLQQLSEVALGEPFSKTLRELLLDSTEVFENPTPRGRRLGASERRRLAQHYRGVTRTGGAKAKRLAFELMQQFGCWRFADSVPIDRLDGMLDTLTAYVRELLSELSGIEEYDLIGLAYKLILRRLEAGLVEPLRLWASLSPYMDQDYRREDKKTVEDWLRANDDVRRAIQRDVILDSSEKPTWQKVSRLSRVSHGLTPNEADVIALLDVLDPTNRADMRWRDLLELISHDGETGAKAREAAKPFVMHDAQLRDWLDRLAQPRVPDWKVKQEAKARQRAARRAVRFGAAKLAAILAGESPANRRSSGHCCSHIQRQEGRPTCRKPGSKSPLGLGRPGLIRHRRASKPTGRSGSKSGSPERRALRETDCRKHGSAELLRTWRRPCSASENWTMTMTKLPGVIEGGMSGKNGQRKLGTTRGSPRRSRTAKA